MNGSKYISARGFTLMELIGVLAVMAILSAMLAPSVFDSINRAYSTAEAGNIEQMGKDLVRYIQTTASIPSRQRNNWSAALASVSSYRVEQLQLNERGYRRAIYFDPRFFSTTEANFNGYTQTSGLQVAPNSPRLMIISDMTRNVPNLPATSSVFDAIWNQDVGARYIESNDIKIHRLNLGQYFHRVLLTNNKTTQPAFALEGQTATPVAAASGAVSGVSERYFLDGTRVTLYADPYPTGSVLESALITGQRGFSYRDNGSYWFWDEQ